MRKILFVFSVFLIFTTCSEDDIDEVLADMTASIDGEDWESVTRVTVLKDDSFIITATTLTGETLVITILGNTEDEYSITTSEYGFTAVYKESASTSTDDAYAAYSGTVELTEVNTSSKTISGTFSFKMLKGVSTTIEVTDGEFNDLNYTISSD